MTATVESVTASPSVEIINRLIRKSFGFGVRGDLEGFVTISDYEDLVPGEKPNIIGRRSWALGSGVALGRFLNADGSELEISRERAADAAMYALLYRALTRKDVAISYRMY